MKLTRPMLKALAGAVDTPGDPLLGQVDGMVRKGLRARGYVDETDRVTEDGHIALRAEQRRLNDRALRTLGLRGVRVGDMVKHRGRWGVVLRFTSHGEALARFGDSLDQFVPGVEIEAVENRP